MSSLIHIGMCRITPQPVSSSNNPTAPTWNANGGSTLTIITSMPSSPTSQAPPSAPLTDSSSATNPTPLWCLNRQKQSGKQIGALFLLVLAAILLSIGEGSGKGSSGSNPDQILFHGIIPVLVASVLSGLASSLCQWVTQVKKHTSYLMTVEMSFVGSLCLLIPVIANAVGGILVGLVTTHAGGVRKGFVIVSALLVTAVLQFVFDGIPPSLYCLIAMPLVISSISIYQKHPYRARKKEE